MPLKNYIVKVLFSLICLFQFTFINAQIDFGPQAQFKYLKGSEAEALTDTWKDAGFDDAAWGSGQAPFRYGDGAGGTVLDDMQGNYTTVYLRGTFTVTDVHLVSVIELGVDYDDGFIIWINGRRLHSEFAPDPPDYNAISTGQHESGTFEYLTFDSTDIDLVEGENIIAIQGFNISLSESTDFLFDMSLQADRDPPSMSGIEINMSHSSGFYDTPFNLTISTPDNTTSLYYTLDGSYPETSPTAINAGAGTTISINPNSSAAGRGTTPGVVLRACLKKPGYKSTFPTCRTYIFREELKYQSDPGGTWPDNNAYVNDQIIDYDMESWVVTGDEYGSEYTAALDQIPTISVITDNTHLFNQGTGIYVNAEGHGIDWERECSVELFNTDLNEGFSANAGLRIRGGWSRHGYFPKHAFRLFFRSLYGDAKLYYPLFEEEGSEQFDKIDLRTAQNYAWSNGRPGNTFVREVFSRDAQGAMGHPYTRSRYYHLFLNGMYWGLFQTQERTEARFAADYLGGSADDYDVVKVNTDEYGYRPLEATDGFLAGWQEVWNVLRDGFEDNENYFKLEGKDELGNPTGGEVMVDIDNLIDYMVGIFYTGNYDSPTSAFGNNKSANNFYAIDNREDESSGFKFYHHDAEHSLFYEESEGPGIGIEMDRVNIGTRTDRYQMVVSSFEIFHPQWLHFKLSDNEEYRLRFADRALKHLGPGGIFTEERATPLSQKRIDQIDQAIILESARWGDGSEANSRSTFTRDDDWYPELESLIDDFFPERTDIVIDQLAEADLWAEIEPPTIRNSLGTIVEQIVDLVSTEEIEIVNNISGSKVYYTLNGSDPRLVGGLIHDKAFSNTENVALSISQSAVINARSYKDGKWSPLLSKKFMKRVEDYSGLEITELHYNPIDRLDGTDTIYGEDYEFIEFKNNGYHPINLTGLKLDSAVFFEFPDNEILIPRQFFVVASNPGAFYEYHGLVASGNYKRNFSNAGELVLLLDKDDNELIRFVYDDLFPWPFAADGGGHSMVASVTNPVLSPDDPSYWIDSKNIEGSPFANDPDSELKVEDFVKEINIKLYPNPTSDYFIFRTGQENAGRNYVITIYNLSGSKVFSAEATEGQEIMINDNGLSSGLYIIQIQGHEINERIKLIYKDR